MMNKKWIVIVSFAVVIGMCILFFINREPTPFLTMEEVTEILNRQDINSPVQVLDIIDLEKSYRFVPFITESGQRGISYWAFNHFEWKLVAYEWDDDVRVWKLRPNDPSSYYFVWHFEAQDEVTQMNIHLLQNRSYRVSGDISIYTPSIQLHKNVSLMNKTYGVMPLPEEWYKIITAISSIQEDTVFDFMSNPQSTYYFGRQTLDEQGLDANLKRNERSASQSGHWVEEPDYQMDYVISIYEEQLERP